MVQRNRIFLLIFATLILAGLVFSNMSPVYGACPEGITSYYKLEEDGGPYFDVFDVTSGIAGTAAPIQTTGIVGFGQEFNGNNTQINVNPDGSFGWGRNESFSIEYWVKRDSQVQTFDGTEVAVGRYDTATGGLGWWTGIDSTGVAAFDLVDKAGNAAPKALGSTDITDGAWHHVVVVRDGPNNENLLYVDGQLEDSVEYNFPAGFESDSAILNIGWLDWSTGFYYAGILDELAIYRRVLTQGEIEQHFNDAQDYCSLPTSNMAGAATSEVLANMNSATAVANLALALADPQYYSLASLYAQEATDNAQDAYDKASAAQNADTSFWGTYGVQYVQSELDYRAQAQTYLDQAVQAAGAGDLAAAENYAIMGLSLLATADLYNGTALWCLSMESDGATQ